MKCASRAARMDVEGLLDDLKPLSASSQRCTDCHDPHEQLRTDAAAYDKACLKCHANSLAPNKAASHEGHACPVATSRCTACHMVKVYVTRCTTTSPATESASRKQARVFRIDALPRSYPDWVLSGIRSIPKRNKLQKEHKRFPSTRHIPPRKS
jgi:hypothetical protein